MKQEAYVLYGMMAMVGFEVEIQTLKGKHLQKKSIIKIICFHSNIAHINFIDNFHSIGHTFYMEYISTSISQYLLTTYYVQNHARYYDVLEIS